MSNFIDLHVLHREHAPTKCFGNFWRCVEYKAAEAALKRMDATPLAPEDGTVAHRGKPAQTLAHPLVALAFMRWAKPEEFYKMIAEQLTQ